MAECAKCNPIDSSYVGSRKRNTRPLPTPVTRQEAAPDGKFLTVDRPDGSDEQPAQLSPNPQLEEGDKKFKIGGEKASTPAIGVSEWKVLSTAKQSVARTREEAAGLSMQFKNYFAEVHAQSRTRLRVDSSPVQVCLAWQDGKQRGGGGGRETAKDNFLCKSTAPHRIASHSTAHLTAV